MEQLHDDETSYKVSYTVSDDFSISYGDETIDRRFNTSDEEVSYWYFCFLHNGGMTLTAAQIEAENTDGSNYTAAEDEKDGN